MERIGPFCSYCEMRVTNMIEVEHVVPVANGGEELDWNNFLLSCRYCNGNKGNNNQDRAGYLWPDRDNTDLAIAYSPDKVVEPIDGDVRAEAAATIDLMGLNRSPVGPVRSTVADLRPVNRAECYLAANLARSYYEAAPSSAMAKSAGLTASGFGFYSIWMTVFANYPEVQGEIREAFPGTYVVMDETGNRTVRPGGLI